MSSQEKTENYGLCQYGDNDIPDWRTDYTGDMAVIDKQLKARVDGESLINKEVTELKQELEEVKKSGRDGRKDLAAAITEKGVATEYKDDMHAMAANVRKISTGVNLTQMIGAVTTTSDVGAIQTTVNHEVYYE